MPWQELKPMDQKVLFIADYLRNLYSFTELCERFYISRKTGYKWVERYHKNGLDGLHELSRKPQCSPLSTPFWLRKAILEHRVNTRITPGAKKIRVLLAKQYPEASIPSVTTIYNILHQEGLIKVRKRRNRVPRCNHPLKTAQKSNELWSVDFKGQLKLDNGQWCYPLTIMDHYSRFMCGCHGLGSTGTTESKQAFIRTFKEYGLPARIRSDNGVPFATRAAGGLSRLAIWWIRLGIIPERIEPGKPQQNGRHERMHRTLKQATAKPSASSMRGQQIRFNNFCEEYNEERPHEALGQETPASVYESSTRDYPQKLPELKYPNYMDIGRVRRTGVIYWHGGQVYISHLLEDEIVGMEEIEDGCWDVYFGPLKIGQIDERKQIGSSTPYWSIKV